MSSNTPAPGTPNPDDRTPPADQPEQPEAFLSDWVGPEEAGPASGPGSQARDPITEQVLFDDLMSDIEAARKGQPTPPADPADALADRPPGDAAGPGSGWFDVPVAEPVSHTPTQPTDSSDVLAGPLEAGSDVLRGVGDPQHPPGAHGSSIFEGRPGSGVGFPGAADASDPSLEFRVPSAAGYADVGQPLEQASDKYADPADPADSGAFADADLINPTGRKAPDTDAEVEFTDSGVDLLHPVAPGPESGRMPTSSLFEMGEEEEGSGEHNVPASSIFEMPRPTDGSELDVSALPMPAEDDEATESIHLPTGESGPPSDLFRGPDTGTAETEKVSFDMPNRDRLLGPDADSGQQVSGLIDWTVPAEASDLGGSNKMSDSEALQAGVPDLRGLAEVDTPSPAPIPTPRPRQPKPSTVPDFIPDDRRRPASRPESAWSVHDMPARSSGRGGWLVGTAVGLLLGAGGFAAAYFGGLLPAKSSDPVRREVATGPQGQTQAPAPGIEEARARLAAGDPAAALKAYEAVGDGVTSPEDRAGRGQARWLARVRELAEQGTVPRANDDQLKAAADDLQAVLDAADQLQTDEQKRAGVTAALHLGLIKETTGDANGATAVYTDAQGKFPAARKVFEASRKRITAMRDVPSGPKGNARLDPRDAQELAQLAVLAVLLLQADAPGAVDEDEAGFHFWEECNQAGARQYDKAIAVLAQAQAAHNRRRMKLAGRGLNPLSDPLEQMFMRCCYELRQFWVLKRDLYEGQPLGPVVRQQGVPGFLADVVKLQEESKKLAGGGPEAKKLQDQLATANQNLKAATDKLTVAAAAADKATADKEAVAKDLTAARKSLDDQMRQLTDAKARLTDAEKRQQAADAALAAVVKELKANKLIGEKDDAAAAIAKLPEVMRKATTAAASADAKKAAEALAQAKADLDLSQAQLQKAQAELARSEKLAKVAADDAKAARASIATEVQKAVDTAQASARRKLDELSAALSRARDEYEAKLAAKDEEHRRVLADARTGVVVPLTSAEVVAKGRASGTYGNGAELFFARRYAEAEAAFDRATKDDPNHAVYWYYLGLARVAQGKPADEAFKKGGELEARNQPSRRAVDAALERVPYAYKRTINGYRP